MRITKTYLTLCAALLGFSPFLVQGADTDAQIKAREALEKSLYGTPAQQPGTTNATPISDEQAREAIRQKMNEMQTQPAAQAMPATNAPAKKQAKKPEPKPKKPAATTAVSQPAPQSAPRPIPPAQSTPTPARVMPTAPAPAPTPAPVTPAPAPVVAPAPVAAKPEPAPKPQKATKPKPVIVAPTPSDPAAIDKAREAMRQKMNEMPAQHAPKAAVATSSAPKKAAKPAPVAKTPTPKATPAPAPQPMVAAPAPQPAVTAPATTQTPVATTAQPAPAAVEAQPAEAAPAMDPNARKQAEQAAKSEASKKHRSKKPAVSTAPVYTPLEGPALGVSADKQQRLADLLQKYQADEISPEQYHAQRAKILAEP